MHEIDAHQSGEGERALDKALSRLCQAQQQEGDQRDGDLDADGVFGSSEEARDLECLLDPAKEQLDCPAPLVELGNLLRGGIEIVGEDAQHLAGISFDAHLAHRIADALPGARVLPGRFNVVQMAIGVRKRAAGALPTVDEFVNRIRSDGTVQKAIAEAGLRGVRVP